MTKIQIWTDEEILFLKNYYPIKGCTYIANKIGKKRSAVYRKASKLGLKIVINPSPNAYTPQDIITIKKYYPLRGGHYVAKMLGRSPAAIHRKAKELRVERQSLIEWSQEEIEYLKKWYYKKRPSEIARRLKRSTGSVLVRARMLGLFKKFARRWTDDEEDFLKKNYLNMTYKQIGKRLNRTARSVQHHAGKMKLVKRIECNWMPWEKRILSRFYGKMPNTEIAKRLNRTRESIVIRARFQKLNKKGPPDYSEKEKRFIRENYLKMTNDQIAKKLKRTRGGIMSMAMKLGLVGREEKLRLAIDKRKDLYTQEEIEFISKNYLKMRNKEIAGKLNRKYSGIIDIAGRLGLSGLPEKQKLWIRGNIETHYTVEEKEFIRKNYLKMTNQQIAAKLKRPVYGIPNIISRLGLSGHPKRRANLKRIRSQSK